MKKIVALLTSVFLFYSLFSQPGINSEKVLEESNNLLSGNTEMAIELAKSVLNNRDTKLRVINPDLSVNDYRLAALISLNLNIKEAAAVLNIESQAV